MPTFLSGNYFLERSCNVTELELRHKIGNNIKYELEDAFMTQKELSKCSGLSETIISKYIHGYIMPSIPNLMRIASALCCSLNDLLVWPVDHIE